MKEREGLRSPQPALFRRETMYQRYGRDPTLMRLRRGMPQNVGRLRPPRTGDRNPLGQDGKPRRCFRCKSTRHYENKCPPGAIGSHIRDLIRNGNPALHIITDLVRGMEGESADPSEFADEPSSPMLNASAKGESEDILHVFDSLSNGNYKLSEGSDRKNDWDSIDERVYESHIASSTGSPALKEGTEQDFR